MLEAARSQQSGEDTKEVDHSAEPLGSGWTETGERFQNRLKGWRDG